MRDNRNRTGLAPGDHRHGSVTGYSEGCRCRECRAAVNAYQRYVRRLKRRGLYEERYVDAAPVRLRVNELMEQGMSIDRVASRAGVTYGVINTLLYGVPSIGLPPRRKLRKENADKIMSVPDVRPEDLMPTALWPIHGAQRRVRALHRFGWTNRKLAERMAVPFTLLEKVSRGGDPGRRQSSVRVSSYLHIRDAYDVLSTHPLPEGEFSRKTANMAFKQGWPNPYEWSDELIDLKPDDLEAALEVIVDAMSHKDQSLCATAAYKYGDLSPVTRAAAHRYKERIRKDR